MSVDAEPAIPRVDFEVAERGQQIVPCPLVSRGRPTFSLMRPEGEVGVAVHAGVGPAALLVSWAASAPSAHGGAGRGPTAYVIETSATSTDGQDGEWRRELSVEHDAASARAHVIDFDGQSWVRLVLAAGEAACILPFARFDLHDASDGSDDCWLLLGDAAFASGSAGEAGAASWADVIHERYPGYFPALIDPGSRSPAPEPPRARELLDAAEAWCRSETHAAARRVAIAWGPPHGELDLLDRVVGAVLDSGRLPVLARQAHGRGRAREAVEAINRRIAALEARHALVPGPDFAAWFEAHPEQLEGGARPTPEGCRAIRQLWAEALDVFYVPQ